MLSNEKSWCLCSHMQLTVVFGFDFMCEISWWTGFMASCLWVSLKWLISCICECKQKIFSKLNCSLLWAQCAGVICFFWVGSSGVFLEETLQYFNLLNVFFYWNKSLVFRTRPWICLVLYCGVRIFFWWSNSNTSAACCWWSSYSSWVTAVQLNP